MRMVPIPPPGSFCQYEAVRDALRRCGGESFIEVGCGAGELSDLLCRRGLRGIGVDFSPDAVALARRRLEAHIEAGRYDLIQDSLEGVGNRVAPVDLGLSMMVMEHVEDDLGFVRDIARLVRPGGHVMIGVPARMDRWSYEDDTVGHLRRYERDDLTRVLGEAGLENIFVWSLGVPVSNLLFRLSDLAVRKGTDRAMLERDQRQQTQASGIREIPWKTVFPAWCKIVLNRGTMYPLHLLQRAFYETNLGLMMLGVGRVPG